MTCREVSTTIASGQVPQRRRLVRLQIWMHLLICSPCRRFWQQVRAIDHGVLSWLRTVEAEAPADLERRVAERLVSGPGASPDATAPPGPSHD